MPFTNVGIDCFGPFSVKHGRTIVKRYGCIFTCLNTRAVHIEILHSLGTNSFINGLLRFIDRHGQPQLICSDYGTNFVGAEKELRQSIQLWNEQAISKAMMARNIKWKFNPPGASHMGGVWERNIRSIMKILGAPVDQTTLSDESLHTLMCIVESIINSRPLTMTPRIQSRSRQIISFFFDKDQMYHQGY